MSDEPDFDNMSMEKVNEYLRAHGYDPEQVAIRGKILVEALLENITLREELAAAQTREARANLQEHEFSMSLKHYIPQADIVEELHLLANSMSSQKALAKKIGITEAFLCDILKGRRNPGPKVCKFLKIHAELVYVEDK